MKKISKLQVFACALSLVPVLLVAVCYSRLPDQVPTHWDMDGTVTYAAKSSLWWLSGMAVLLAAVFPVLPRIDPRRRNYSKFQNSYELFQIVMMLFLIGMTGIVIMESFYPGTVDVGMVVTGLCSLLFVILGNMLPKFRHNYFCGLKNPWTLASETVWSKTHRLGGRTMFAAGLIGLASCFLPERLRFVVFFGVLIAAILIPNIMSYIWYRRERNGEP